MANHNQSDVGEAFGLLLFILTALAVVFGLFIGAPVMIIGLCVNLLIAGDPAGLIGVFAVIYLFWAIPKCVRSVVNFFSEEKEFFRNFLGIGKKRSGR